MAKKISQKVDLSAVLRIVALVMGAVALCFAFLAGVKFTGKLVGTEVTVTGFEAMFGKEDLLGFSFMTMIAFLLPVAGGVLIMFKSKLLNIIATACFLVGAIFLFIVPSFVVLVEGSLFSAYTASLAVGTILAAIMSILATLVAGYVTFSK